MKKSTHLKPSLLLSGTLLLFSPWMMRAQDLAYDSGSDGSDGAFVIPDPFHPGLQGLSMAHDPIRNELILFGGTLSDANDAPALGRMWTWDGESFTERTPDPLPPARHGAEMVWDAAREEILLFGGRDGAVIRNDTWTWDGATWTLKVPDTSPQPRWEFGMAYDAVRQNVVLFGGGIGSPLTNDTWIWDGVNWTLAEPVDKPSSRFQHSMAFYGGTGKVVIYGGRSGSSVLNETWEWDGLNWTKLEPTSSPNPVVGATMTYDPVRDVVVLFGGSGAHRGDLTTNQIWLWDGSNWEEMKTQPRPAPRFFHAAAFHSEEGLIYIVGGENDDVDLNDVWTLSGAGFQPITGRGYVVDLGSKPDGIFNFTSIDIPSNVSVSFHSNIANTPVIWRASENVEIFGEINLSGKDGVENLGSDTGAPGGPGGFRGGVGGINEDISGSYAGQPGLGAGGGAPGMDRFQNAQDGQFAGVYGNLALNPLLGGSGGGGGGSTDGRGGSGGGGGGGAILIASSKDIILEGSIVSKGGTGSTINGDGGAGSGGAVLLIADRLLGTGSIDVSSDGGPGIVRLEGYERPLASGSVTTPIVGFPDSSRSFENRPELMIASVAGLGIPEDPLGTFSTPDVTLSSSEEVEIRVTARNLPDGTPVRLRMSSAGGSITIPDLALPAPTLTAGAVTFQVVLPDGVGALQAVAEF